MTTEETTETKTCAKCGQTKPTSEFYKHSKSSDGLQPYCKDCHKQYAKNRQPSLPALLLDPAAFHDPRTQGLTPRDLIDELAARGYHGTLEYTEVKVHRIKV